MSLMPMNGAEPPAIGETPGGEALLNESVQTALVLVQKARGTDGAQEAKDFADAVLKLSQVIALLDPTRDEQGIPLDHQMQMQKLKSDAELEKVKEQSKAQAPTPTKTVKVNRAKPDGPATGYEVTG